MKKFWETLFTIFLYLAMAWGEFGGIYHTYTRHKEDLISTILIPPISWYRSVEFFLHKEYSGERWEKTRVSDASMILTLVGENRDENANKVKLEEEITAFSRKISKYPDDKKAEIKAFFDDFILFQESLFDDFISAFSSYGETGDLGNVTSDKTNNLRMKIEDYGQKNNMDMVFRAMDYLMKDFKEKLDKVDKDKFQAKFKDMKEYLALSKESDMTGLRNLSQRIFD